MHLAAWTALLEQNPPQLVVFLESSLHDSNPYGKGAQVVCESAERAIDVIDLAELLP
jgi:hypothetical protein